MVQCSFRPPNADYLGFKATMRVSSRRLVGQRNSALTRCSSMITSSSMGPPQVVTSWGNTYDPLVVLSYVAACTKRIRLGTSVLIMPYRNPVATAKMMATLDQMSEGRVIAGVGAGWNAAEFAALGVPFHERGARTTEYLRLWQACWAPDPVTFQGQFFSFARCISGPSRCSSLIPRSGLAAQALRACAVPRRSRRSGNRPRCRWKRCVRGKPICVRPVRRSDVGGADHPYELSGQFPRHHWKRRTQQHPGGRAADRAGNPQRKWPRTCGAFGTRPT